MCVLTAAVENLMGGCKETRWPLGIEQIRAVFLQTSGAHMSLIRLVYHDETVGRCVLLQDNCAAKRKI